MAMRLFRYGLFGFALSTVGVFMQRNVFPSVLLSVAVTLVSTPSWADDWKLQKYPNDKFQVEWSGPVKITATKVSDSTQKLLDHSTTYLQDNHSSAYVAGAMLALPGTKITLETAAEASIKTKNCKQLDKHSIDVKNANALEYIGTGCIENSRVRSRFFTKDKWLYEATAVTGANDDLSVGQHFVDSFKIIDE
jgi:hypothetical protein